jgi:hypothetical protein
MINPDFEEKTNKFYKESIVKFNEYKLENIETYKYLNIIINNSSSDNAICEYINTLDKFVNNYIKIFLYTNEGIKFIIGPTFIDSIEKIHYITNYIVMSIRRDYYIEDYNNINNNIDEYFIHDKNERLIFM